MKNADEKEDLGWETYLHKKQEEEVRIFHDYVGWKIYCRMKPYRLSDRDELKRKYKRRFQTWNCEEKDREELTLSDPECPEHSITIRFGNFVTPSQRVCSVEIESFMFGWKKRHMRDHSRVLKRMLRMLSRGKKELYRIGNQGLPKRINVRHMKYSQSALLDDRRSSYM